MGNIGILAGCATAVAVALLIAPVSGKATETEQVTRGQQVYKRCLACHSLDRNRTGPRHCGLFGREAGSLPGFRYSPAMTSSGIVWDRDTLDRFIENPRAFIPGNRMGYAGIRDSTDRRAIVAYLEWANRPGGECDH
jgi:cytochrome c